MTITKKAPEGYHSVTPYLTVPRVEQVLQFLQATVDATVVEEPQRRPDGTIMHADVRIGDSRVMMGEPTGRWKAMPASLYVYVDDVDATYARALKAGGVSLDPPSDQFYGDRHAGVEDPGGNAWWFATRVEDVPPDEMKRRHAQYAAQKPAT